MATVNFGKRESHMPLKEKKSQTPILLAVQETCSSCQYILGKNFLKEMFKNVIFDCLGFFRDIEK